MVGFTEAEVRRLMELCRDRGVLDQDLDGAIALMGERCNGYRFAEDADTDLYNTDMVLYYLKHSTPNRGVPFEFLGEAIAATLLRLPVPTLRDMEDDETDARARPPAGLFGPGSLSSDRSRTWRESGKNWRTPLTRFSGLVVARCGARRPLRLSERDFASVDAAGPR